MTTPENIMENLKTGLRKLLHQRLFSESKFRNMGIVNLSSLFSEYKAGAFPNKAILLSHKPVSTCPTRYPTLPCGQSRDDVSRQALTSNYTSDDNNLKLMFSAGELSGHFKS